MPLHSLTSCFISDKYIHFIKFPAARHAKFTKLCYFTHLFQQCNNINASAVRFDWLFYVSIRQVIDKNLPHRINYSYALFLTIINTNNNIINLASFIAHLHVLDKSMHFTIKIVHK